MIKEPPPQLVRVAGSTVHYWIYNKKGKHTVVALHGFRGTHHGLAGIIKASPDCKFIVPDLPGFGQSTPMTKYKHDVDGYYHFAKQFIKAIGVNRPILLGHSFGTIIGAKLAADNPELVSKLVFVNPVAVVAGHDKLNIKLGMGSLYYWLAGKALPEELGLSILRNRLLFLVGSALLTKTKDKETRKWIHTNHILHFGSFHTRQILKESYDASLEHAIEEFAPKIKAPTLLVVGVLDEMAPLKSQYVIEKLIPNVKLVTVPNVGHLIHYETPVQAAKAMREFLTAK